MNFSVNNRLILEPYKGTKKLEMEVKSGFGTIKAKSALIGLALLEDAQVLMGNNTINIAYQTVLYFREETLTTNPSYKTIYELENKSVVLGSFLDVVYIGEKK